MIITDFGLSKLLDNSTNSITGGTCAYSDPQYLQSPFMYRRNKPSDIYTVLAQSRNPIEGTPNDFKNLYCAAWSVYPDSRPDIKEICNKLNHMQLEPVYKHINTNNLNYKYKGNTEVTIETAIPYFKFIPIINDIINITEERALIIVAVETSLRLLKAYKDEDKEFFNKQNFVAMQKLFKR
ncbi:hypothetical protein C2G38_2184944 [Gigaspora rosea]|uniref:Protein kinase domain-containing protein n=1 Tax=Gigaspora rosea TaxID=44941 RepID=A0A397V8P9_9GLOM|nr:hypothetical protein C2G38_2184944 [Gigaspora rosea]